MLQLLDLFLHYRNRSHGISIVTLHNVIGKLSGCWSNFWSHVLYLHISESNAANVFLECTPVRVSYVLIMFLFEGESIVASKRDYVL